MATEDLTTLADAKEHLRITDASKDALLSTLITAATHWLEKECQTYLVQRAITDERHTGGRDGRFGGAKRIYVRRYPVVSVAQIVDEATPANSVPATNYVLFKDSGILEHYYSWPAALAANGAIGFWKITYTPGHFASTAVVDTNVKLACKFLVAKLFEDVVPDVRRKDIGSFYVEYVESERLPRAVAALVGPYMSGVVH